MFTNDKICSAGLIYFYITGVVQDDGLMSIEVIESGNHLPDAFYNNASEISMSFDNYPNGIEVFGLIGSSDRITPIKDIVRTGIQDNYNRILRGEEILTQSPTLDTYGNSFFKLVQEYFCERTDGIPTEYSCGTDNWELYCIHKGGEKFSQYAENALSIWLDAEKPTIMGKQLILRSFLYRDLIGRKVVGNIPDYRDGSWNVIFEGGIKLPTGIDDGFIGEKLDFDSMHKLTISQIDLIINNPCYAYGKVFLPVALCSHWYKALLYTCAISEVKWSFESFSRMIDDFICFLENYICYTIEAPPLISKDVFINAALKEIDKMRELLEGRETIVISKDILHLLRSRYVFLPYMYEFIHYKTSDPTAFSKDKIMDLIQQSDTTRINDKGIFWEDVAEYVISSISGLKVSGKRVKTKYQEIDISVVNTSLSENLWQLGAYILVECKNWKRKVDIPVIRNLAYTSLTRGTSTIFLFAANGVTRDAQEEIHRLTTQDIFVIVITKKDIMSLDSSEDCLNLIMDKFRYLKTIQEDEFNI